MSDLPDFSKVYLSSREIRLLKRFGRRPFLADDYGLSPALRTLRFIEPHYSEKRNAIGEPEMDGFRISGAGKRYLLFLKVQKRSQRRETRRYWLTTAIAWLGFVLALIALLSESGILSIPRLLGLQE